MLKTSVYCVAEKSIDVSMLNSLTLGCATLVCTLRGDSPIVNNTMLRYPNRSEVRLYDHQLLVN